MRSGINGLGAVGTACAFAAVMRGCVRALVLLERDGGRAREAVTDLQYGAALSPAITLTEGDYHDLAGADLVMITGGVNERADGSTDRGDPGGWLWLLDANAAVYSDVVPRVVGAAPQAMILVVTDPRGLPPARAGFVVFVPLATRGIFLSSSAPEMRRCLNAVRRGNSVTASIIPRARPSPASPARSRAFAMRRS